MFAIGNCSKFFVTIPMVGFCQVGSKRFHANINSTSNMVKYWYWKIWKHYKCDVPTRPPTRAGMAKISWVDMLQFPTFTQDSSNCILHSVIPEPSWSGDTMRNLKWWSKSSKNSHFIGSSCIWTKYVQNSNPHRLHIRDEISSKALILFHDENGEKYQLAIACKNGIGTFYVVLPSKYALLISIRFYPISQRHLEMPIQIYTKSKQFQIHKWSNNFSSPVLHTEKLTYSSLRRN